MTGEGLYGTAAGDYPDNAERFALYCRAVLEATKQLGVPEVFHVHDWQAALIPVYLRTTYASDPALERAGVGADDSQRRLPGRVSAGDHRAAALSLGDLHAWTRWSSSTRFNFLKGGLVYSEMLTTVSRKYAEEIQTAEFGEGLEGVLRGRAADLRGILNGVDYAQWNPATDANLAAHYSPEDLAGKRPAAPICCASLGWRRWRSRRR